MKSYFDKYYDKIAYPINSDGRQGLRNAQLGAMHALASFYTLNKHVASIIVMPTGSGKTAVLMLVPYLFRNKRLLIVTSSKMVRGQIAEDFSELKTLCSTNVFSNSVKKPNVYELEHNYSSKYQKNIENADVIVATPNCALSLSEDEWVKSNIDIVEIDEAHHTPAKTWHQILINFSNSTHVLFTATPFRLDKKNLIGEIIYDYPLSKAYEDGIFGEIRYISVDTTDGNTDLSIAKKAEEVFINDRNMGLSHYLMVRTGSKNSANYLDELYKNNTTLKLSKIDSSMSNSKIKQVLTKLKSKELDGIICVDMLGEGFDFPNLKIAAIHVPHKSLASTLQFIGRFARTNASDIGEAKFIAVDNEELEIEKNKLYSKDSVWQDIIIEMSETKNKIEYNTRKYFQEYVYENTNIDEIFSLQAIRLNCHVKIYKSNDFDFNASFPEICNVSERVFRNKIDSTVVGIGLEYESPLWLASGKRINTEYLLYIVHYQKNNKMVYIYSQKHSEVIYDEIISSFCTSYDQIPKSEIHRVLGKLNNFEFFNSGMINKQSQSGESYRILAGSDVSGVIDVNSGRMYSAGHVFCKAEDSSDGEITIGYSSASKVWSSSYKNIKDYITWCDSLGDKISNNKIIVKTNTNYDYLPHPEKLTKYPKKIFYAEFSDKTYNSAPLLVYVENGVESDPYSLIDSKIIILDCNEDKVKVSVSIGDHSEIIECDLKAKYKSIQNNFIVCLGNYIISLDNYLTEYPLIFKTVEDDTITGTEIITGNFDGSIFDNSKIYGLDWKKYNADLHLEYRNDINDSRVSIQDALFEYLKSNSQYKYIIYDHGTGEIADYITIYENEEELAVELYHVKKMSGKSYNKSVSDIYEVCGQAIKSVNWFKTKGELIMKMNARHNSGHCIIKRGGDFIDMIHSIRSSNKVLHGHICIVQPGIKRNAPISEKMQEVLAATDYYIKYAGKVNEFKIFGSN